MDYSIKIGGEAGMGTSMLHANETINSAYKNITSFIVSSTKTNVLPRRRLINCGKNVKYKHSKKEGL